MTDTTDLIQRLRLMSPDLIGGEAADALEQQAAQIEVTLVANPPRAPLTDEHVTAVVRSVCPNLAETSKAWRDLVVECRYWLEAAHGIGGK